MHLVRADPTRYVAAAHAIFTAHEGRPHCAKIHTLDATYVADRYKRFDGFVSIRDQVDPGRRFDNDYLDRVLP